MKLKSNSIFNKVSNILPFRGNSERLPIIHLSSVDSTNNYLMAYKPREGETMTVVYADEQTAGRGQGSNHWESEPGKNLTFSVLVHPTMVPVMRQFLLSEAGALALWDVLGQYLGADDVKMKWPNDIYWKDKKISGTLIETRLGGGHVKDCVYGIGIDVNQEKFVSDAPNPVSMKQILDHDVDLKELLNKIIDSFKKYYAKNTEKTNKEYLFSWQIASMILQLTKNIRNRAFHLENLLKLQQNGLPRLSAKVDFKNNIFAIKRISPNKLVEFLDDILNGFGIKM